MILPQTNGKRRSCWSLIIIMSRKCPVAWLLRWETDLSERAAAVGCAAARESDLPYTALCQHLLLYEMLPGLGFATRTPKGGGEGEDGSEETKQAMG